MDPVANNVDGGNNSQDALSRTNAATSGNSVTESMQKQPSVWSWLGYALVIFAIALVIRIFVASPYVVQGTSMLNTFQNWNYVIVDKLSYDFEAPQRGDVVVLDSPQTPGRTLIKRIIGLPGDTVVLSGADPTVTIINGQYPQGFTLQEPYVDPANYGGASNMRVTLGPNEYFVMGDNRVVSLDSRYIGDISRSEIIGRVFVRLYPFNEIGILPGEARYAATSTAS